MRASAPRLLGQINRSDASLLISFSYNRLQCMEPTPTPRAISQTRDPPHPITEPTKLSKQPLVPLSLSLNQNHSASYPYMFKVYIHKLPIAIATSPGYTQKSQPPKKHVLSGIMNPHQTQNTCVHTCVQRTRDACGKDHPSIHRPPYSSIPLPPA